MVKMNMDWHGNVVITEYMDIIKVYCVSQSTRGFWQGNALLDKQGNTMHLWRLKLNIILNI